MLNGVSDWRLAMDQAESGASCGTGCNHDREKAWVQYSTLSFTGSPTTALPISKVLTEEVEMEDEAELVGESILFLI
jgi:hypothetical protein